AWLMTFTPAFPIRTRNCHLHLHRCLAWTGMMLLASVTACSIVPPRELIERHDHAGLAAWYEQEAARLRGKAEEMRQMAAEYAKPSYQSSPKTTKSELIDHCHVFIRYYTQAAEEAETLAKLHRQQEQAIP
ncbi:MAG TPA: hypothetical protein VLA99_06085, partial [Nitrospiraceae bacterium]|nr:hypothetical protein [Nitrospiraceae bacterium]